MKIRYHRRFRLSTTNHQNHQVLRFGGDGFAVGVLLSQILVESFQLSVKAILEFLQMCYGINGFKGEGLCGWQYFRIYMGT